MAWYVFLTPEAPPVCDWPTDDAGITEFIGLSIQFGSFKLRRARTVLFSRGTSRYHTFNLDAAAYRWLQINSAGHAAPGFGTIGYR